MPEDSEVIEFDAVALTVNRSTTNFNYFSGYTFVNFLEHRGCISRLN
jgi:hypothetical protein